MNAKQLRAKSRRERQKQNKKLKFKKVDNKDNINDSDSLKCQSPLSLLNKRVTFDHLTFDPTGFIITPLSGTITKISPAGHILTILIDSHQQRHRNKRIESLLGSEVDVIEATAASLPNFKLT